jgi:hypothetical protein
VKNHPILFKPILAFDEGELLFDHGRGLEILKKFFEEDVTGRSEMFLVDYFLDCSKKMLRKPGETSI